ncbi:aminotransferase class III-fold pyridoxal phosphate-dependent enzyme [Phenylobacterium sp.]|uniref:aminotransferase class III-fold pyridoxal phosphate-dependent enzyme n=1 Tax=Phenylobacterium sp. TaxID=1871053 RepID=UPI00289641B6|nr:aminotransferase class III-fold pyridoxal phosphate-dependent enzyme [Phenylobacterium sp.]
MTPGLPLFQTPLAEGAEARRCCVWNLLARLGAWFQIVGREKCFRVVPELDVTVAGRGDVAEVARRALEVMPGGASHDGRQLEPGGPFVRRAAGPFKTGVDGRELVDLQCGNGSLLLGHAHPGVVEAGLRAIEAGLNFSAGSEAEVAWAEAVCALMPGAEQIRFTASGNEACALSFAIARAVTGRAPVLVLRDHYCGWMGPALLRRVAADRFLDLALADDEVVLVEAQDVAQALAVLASRRVSSIIFEPTGGSFGKLPLSAADALALGETAGRHGSLCIADETITGFRVAPGGAQKLLGLKPDLTILGKILGGGLPAGALAGSRGLMKALDNRPGGTGGPERVAHMGTGNGNPVVAAVGLATLAAIADGELIRRANAAATALRAGLNAAFARQGVGWAAYGEHSALHIFINPLGRSFEPRAFDPSTCAAEELRARPLRLVNDLRVELLRQGLDLNNWPGGLLSAAHDASAVERAIEAFARALDRLAGAGQALIGWGRA